MKISNNKINNSGFTLIELVIVISGLAALMSFAIPSYMNAVKLNKVEQAKAIINGYAADCLSQYRSITNAEKQAFITNKKPTQLNNLELASLGYQIDGDKDKCSELSIKPINEKEEKLFNFGFNLEEDADTEFVMIRKTAEPSSYTGSKSFLNSCQGWAGGGCGLSDAQKAEFARKAALAKLKADCISKYTEWLNAGNSGGFSSWDNTKNTCDREVFAFEGIPVNSAEAVDQAIQNAYGKACLAWRIGKRNTISPNGNPETLNKECGGVKYWFHSGEEFTTQAAWTAYDNQIKEQACIKDRSDAISQRKTGEYTYSPTTGPEPCGKTVWLCNGVEYNSPTAYATTSCGAQNTGVGSSNDRCATFTPNPMCQYYVEYKDVEGLCKCTK